MNTPSILKQQIVENNKKISAMNATVFNAEMKKGEYARNVMSAYVSRDIQALKEENEAIRKELNKL